MLYEIKNVKQYQGEPKRRWFFDHEIDLLVWFDDRDEIVGFQLCYDKLRDQRALTWFRGSGYHYNRVDDGERDGGRRGVKAIPVLLMDGSFDHRRIAAVFREKSKDIPNWISTFVYEKIASYSS